MKHRYAPADAEALAPLLDSIGRELAERGARLTAVEGRIAALRSSPFFTAELGPLEAEAADLRRELRHCHEELERLGLSVVGTAPLRVRIPTEVAGSKRSLVWKHDAGSNN